MRDMIGSLPWLAVRLMLVVIVCALFVQQGADPGWIYGSALGSVWGCFLGLWIGLKNRG